MGYTDLPNYKAGIILEEVYPPILIIVGLLGNVLSILVLCLRKNRKTSTAVLLTGLAIADTMVLLVALSEKWINAMFSYSVRTSSDAMCKIHVFLTYYLLQLSPWFLIAITIERVCCVRYPHLVKDAFTRKRSIYLLLTIALVLCGANSHIIYGFERVFIPEINMTLCLPREDYQDFMFFVWPWIDFSLMFAMPCVILISGNILIYITLKASVLFSRSLYGNCTINISDRTFTDKTPVKCTLSNESVHRQSPNASRRASREAKNSFFTLTMFILNISFILCVSPTNVLTIGQTYWYPLPVSPEETAELHLISKVCFMFMYCNNAINFFLYILLGPKFRKDVMKILCTMFKCVDFCHSSRYKVSEISPVTSLYNVYHSST